MANQVNDLLNSLLVSFGSVAALVIVSRIVISRLVK